MHGGRPRQGRRVSPNLAGVPPRTTKEIRTGPLYTRAVANILRMLEAELEMDQKELCLGIGMSDTVFSAKKIGARSHFYEDEFETIAEFFRRKTGRPLTGFPHLAWQDMLACDRKVFGWHG